MTRPIFLVSLPRSGSTLLQKMLSVSPCVASAAEPWVLLPLVLMRDENASRSIYSSHVAANAVNEFIDSIQGGDKCFDRAVRNFALELYGAAADGLPYFLDKTPRYYLIVEELMRVFPDAKFILLTRNPMAVLASISRTFCKGRFAWFDYWVDWLLGHERMAKAIESGGDRDNVLVVRYEELIKDPSGEMARISSWLGISFMEDMISKYKTVQWTGRMGDPKGVSSYQSVSIQSTLNWRSFYSSRFRKMVGSEMLDKVGAQTLALFGYPIDDLKNELNGIPNDTHFDLRARRDYLANQFCSIFDYRYRKLFWKGKMASRQYSCGRLHNL